MVFIYSREASGRDLKRVAMMRSFRERTINTGVYCNGLGGETLFGI